MSLGHEPIGVVESRRTTQALIPMQKHLHNEYPHYGWDTNKGYGTIHHRRQLQQHGMSPYHRKTFNWTEVTDDTADGIAETYPDDLQGITVA